MAQIIFAESWGVDPQAVTLPRFSGPVCRPLQLTLHRKSRRFTSYGLCIGYMLFTNCTVALHLMVPHGNPTPFFGLTAASVRSVTSHQEEVDICLMLTPNATQWSILDFSGAPPIWTTTSGFSVQRAHQLHQSSIILINFVGVVGFEPTAFLCARFTVWCPSTIWAALPLLRSFWTTPLISGPVWFIFAGEVGLEPTTFWLTVRC